MKTKDELQEYYRWQLKIVRLAVKETNKAMVKTKNLEHKEHFKQYMFNLQDTINTLESLSPTRFRVRNVCNKYLA